MMCFQDATGGETGWGAVPGRLLATVPAALAALNIRTGTVEPAAGPVESCLHGGGANFPVTTCLS